MQNNITLIDMDEVLVDFVGGALAVWGVSRADLDRYWEPGTWSIVPPLAKALGDPDFDDNKFWTRINAAGAAFWEGLEPLPWWRDLVSLVERQLGEEWYILSSPSRCVSSRVGKITALKRMFGPRFERFVLTPHKHLLAGQGKILIDDREETCNRFVGCGGDAVVFPSRHNSLHHVDDPITYLEQLLCI